MLNLIRQWLNPKPKPGLQTQSLSAEEVSQDPRVGEEAQHEDELLQDGIAKLQDGDTEAALACFEQVLEKNVLTKDAWYQKGLALQTLGRYEAAIAANKRFQDLNGFDKKPNPMPANLLPKPKFEVSHQPDLAEGWFERGNQQYGSGDFLGAIDSYDKALELTPEKHCIWGNRGIALRNLGRNDEAIASYDKVLEFNLNDHQAFFNRGLSLVELGRYEEAIASYDKALEFKPNFHEAWFNRGLALDRLVQYEAAIASYDKALEIKPDDHQAWCNRGIALDELGQHEEAIASFDKALEFKLDDHKTWYDKGNALHHLGFYEEAISSYDKALEFRLAYPEAWSDRGVALAIAGFYEEAVSSFNKALEFKPDYHVAWYNRANALCHFGRHKDDLIKFSEGIASYDKALKINPDLDAAWYNRGNALGDIGNHEDAIASYDKALKITPHKHEAWNSRGSSLHHLGHYEEAIASFDKSLKIKPDDHVAWYNRGTAVLSSPKHSPIHSLMLGATLSQQYPQLNQRDYPGQVITLETGLMHVALHSEGWIYLQQKLGEAHFDQGKNEHRRGNNARSFWRNAQYCFEEAFAALSNATLPDPDQALEILQFLIRIYLAFGNISLARQRQQQGRPIFEELRAAQPNERKPNIEFKFHSFSQLEIDLLIDEENPAQALEQAEFYKNRCLTWILDAWQEQVTSPSFAEMQTLCTPDTAILYWHLSPDSLSTFILTHAAQPWVLDCDRTAQAQAFEQWMKAWDTDYRDYASKKTSEINNPERKNHPWRKALRDRLLKLRQILKIDTLLPTLPNTLTHLILIPHRDLHRFPLHTLFPDSLTCTYLPSLQIGLNLNQKVIPNPTYAPLLIVEDSKTEQKKLDYSQLEAAILEKLIPENCDRIRQEEATTQQVKAQLNLTHAVFHFTGHGAYNALRPEDSALGLADGKLTAKAIAQLNLSSYQLISLAACETALTGRESIQTEYVGLASAALKAGAANVLSTLWQVDEIASCWFMIHFYQQLLAGKLPAIALQNTQIWLKTITWQELANWLRNLSQFPGFETGMVEWLETRSQNTLKEGSTIGLDQPTKYSHPYYWATFTLTGQG